jgi:predicted nucleic acid-binding protein
LSRRRLLAYLDSSAIFKLAVVEPETDALRAALRHWPERASSALARLEVIRAVRRAAPAAEGRARELLTRLALIPISEDVLRRAAAISPAGVRTLDAIHVATALGLGEDCGVVLAYDRWLLEAAASEGLTTTSPGLSVT